MTFINYKSDVISSPQFHPEIIFNSLTKFMKGKQIIYEIRQHLTTLRPLARIRTLRRCTLLPFVTRIHLVISLVQFIIVVEVHQAITAIVLRAQDATKRASTGS